MTTHPRLTIALLAILGFVLSLALALFFLLRSATPKPRARSFV